MLLLCCPANAQEADFTQIIEFADEYGVQQEVQGLIDDALSGELDLFECIAEWIREALSQPLKIISQHAFSMIAPVLLLVFVRAILPESGGAATGVAFLLRMILLLEFSYLVLEALEGAAKCLGTVNRFTDIISPALTALLSAISMQGSAALISPAAALAGNAAEGLFQKYGLALCRVAFCTGIAGNLSTDIDLARFSTLLRKAVNWLAGLAFTLFTALLALQGSVSESLDGIAVRTAKFAVDSAAPVIGSGVSDAWESYVSSVMISKNALGVSGIAALLFACARPMLLCLFSMLLLSITAAILDVFGEKLTARASQQLADVCQMALSLCTGALAIGTILLGAAMAAGKGLLS